MIYILNHYHRHVIVVRKRSYFSWFERFQMPIKYSVLYKTNYSFLFTIMHIMICHKIHCQTEYMTYRNESNAMNKNFCRKEYVKVIQMIVILSKYNR